RGLSEEARPPRGRFAQETRRADLRAVATITGGELHDHDIAVFERPARRPRIAEDQRWIFHGGRADDREVEIASPFENGATGGGFELVLCNTGPAASH